MQLPHAGGADAHRWPASGRAVEYTELRVRSILRQQVDPGYPWYWSLNPYRGCEFGCTFCQARLDRADFSEWRAFESRIGVKTDAALAFLRDIRAEDFQGRQVVLGTSTEPWQPAEERFRITRALLEAMARLERVDLRVNTRSSLIARDSDLLRAIAAQGRVTVAFSLASLDERINRAMEPHAPSALRRLAALEALARAGLTVGILLSPVFAGARDEELRLEALLTRAANAGARFAGISLMHFAPGQRETFLAHVATAYPQHAARLKRWIGARGHTEDEKAALFTAFERHCARLGLTVLHRATPAPQRTHTPSQLPLFSA